MACFRVEAEHMHKGSTQSLWSRRNSIYLFQIRVTAPLSSHRHRQTCYQPSNWSTNSDLTAFLTGQEGLNPDGSSSDLKGVTRGSVGTTTTRRDPNKFTLLPALHTPQFFISFIPREEFVPGCCGVLWPCRDTRAKHFSVSQFQLKYLRLWH